MGGIYPRRFSSSLLPPEAHSIFIFYSTIFHILQVELLKVMLVRLEIFLFLSNSHTSAVRGFLGRLSSEFLLGRRIGVRRLGYGREQWYGWVCTLVLWPAKEVARALSRGFWGGWAMLIFPKTGTGYAPFHF